MLDRSLEFHFLGRVDVAEGGELGPLRRRLVVGIRVSESESECSEAEEMGL